MNRSIARASLGAARRLVMPSGERERNPALRLKITSSIRRRSHQQGRAESGILLRTLRRASAAADQWQLPEPLSVLPVVQARRCRPARGPGLRLPRPHAACGDRAAQRQGHGDRASLHGLRFRAAQPGRGGSGSERQRRGDHRADAVLCAIGGRRAIITAPAALFAGTSLMRAVARSR